MSLQYPVAANSTRKGTSSPRSHRQLVRVPRIVSGSIAAALLPSFGFAADAIKTWDLIDNGGTATTNANFYNNLNWDLDVRPTFTGNTDSIVFNGSGAGSISLNINGGLTEYLVKSFTFTGGAYTFTGAQNLTFGDATASASNTGNLTNNSTGTQAFNSTGTIAFSFGTINAASGAFTFNANPTINIGNNSNAAGRNLIVDGAFNVTINSLLAGAGTDTSNGGALIKNGTGTLFLQGESALWNGRLTINSGTVEINRGLALGSAEGRTTIAGGEATGRLNIKGGINLTENLYLEGRTSLVATPHVVNLNGENAISSPIRLASGGTEYAIESTAGNLTLNGGIVYDTATDTTNVRLGGNGNGVVNGTIGSPTSAINLTKDGAGTWTLNAANSYTGATSVSAGRLNLTTAQSGGGAISISDGATLGLTVSGAGQSLVTSSLTIGSLTGSTLALDTGAVGNPNTAIITANSFTTNGTNTLSIKSSAAPLSIGQFALIDYTGTIGGAGFAGLSLGALPARVTANLVDDIANTRVLLNVTAFDIPRWTGAIDSNWDLDDGTGTGTQNWKELNSGLVTKYLQGPVGTDSVIFDDTAAATATNVNLVTVLTPATVTVNNSALTYTFSGTGSLSGAAALIKQGTNTLIIANTGVNDYTGTTTIAGGTLQIGDGITLGAGSLGTGNIINNGTLVLNRPDAFAIGPVIGGSGAIIKQGTGEATISANNNFTGTVTIAAGSLRLGNSNALGSTVAGTTIQSGAALDVNGRLVPAGEIISVSGIGLLDSGAIVNNGTGGANIGVKNVVLTGATSFGGSTRFDIRDNLGGLNANGFRLTKVGTNNIFLANIGETHLGEVVITTGRLAFEGDTTLGDQTGTITVASGAELGLEDSKVVHTKPIQVDGGTINATLGADNTLSGPITLNGSGTFRAATSVTLLVNSDITGIGNFLKAAPGVVILAGNNTYNGVTTVTQGTLRVGNDGPSGSLGTGDVSLEAASGQTATLGLRRSDTGLIVANNISSPGAGTNVVNIGATNGTVPPSAIITLSGNNTFTGAVNVNGGSLRITNSSALGIGPKAVSIATNGKPSLRLDGTTGDIILAPDLSFVTSNDDATYPAILNEAGNNVIGGTIALSNGNGGNTRVRVDAGTLTLNGGIAPATTATSSRTLILDGVGNGTVNGAMVSGSQTLALTKSGAGTWTINGANSYTGNTTIQAGTLKLGTLASITASPSISLSTGSTLDVSSNLGFTLASNQTLTGSGSVLGNVTQASNAIVTPGSTTTAATLTFDGNLSFSDGARIRANVGTPNVVGSGVNDLLTVNGSLSATGTTTFEITPTGAPLTGSYRLIDYTGNLNGTAANFALSHNTRFVLSIDLATPKQVNLVASGSAANLIWSGDGGANVWNVNNSANWNSGTEKFYQVDSVTFDDSTPNSAITIAETVIPNSVLINAAQNYTFTGTGGINGAPGGLTKDGGGIATLITANNYTGPTQVNEGTLIVTGSINGSAITVNDGGTIGGAGTITTNNQAFTLNEGARLSPGVAEGTLTINTGTSTLDLTGAVGGTKTGALLFGLDTPTTSDRVTLSGGTLNIGTGVLGFNDFVFSLSSGFSPGTYTLFTTNTSIVGSFDPDPGHLSGDIAGFDSFIEFGDNGTDIVLHVVPEPGVASLAIAALGSLVGLRRRRFKQLSGH